ncbi:MAG: hypothetical protein GX306_11920 [Clostridiales bacterium]|jgi:hypothetical protein|nr:hypothetical protein [Clostridiales bacterium]
MTSKTLNDYEIANITESEKNKITELEQSLRSSSKKDIVLIAYQPKCSNTGRSGFKC